MPRGFELSVFIHLKAEKPTNPLTREAYFLGANQNQSVHDFYKQVDYNIAKTPALADQVGNKLWFLFHNNQRLPRSSRQLLGSFTRPSFTTLDLNLVFYHGKKPRKT